MCEKEKVLIQWTLNKTGEKKVTKHPIAIATAEKLVKWLNKSNRKKDVGSVYEIVY